MGSDETKLRSDAEAHNQHEDGESDWQAVLRSTTAVPLEGEVSRRQLLDEFNGVVAWCSWAQRHIVLRLERVGGEEPLDALEQEMLATMRALRADVLGIRTPSKAAGIRNSIIEEAERHKDHLVLLRDSSRLMSSVKEAAREALDLTVDHAREVSAVHAERLIEHASEALHALLEGVAGHDRVFVGVLTDILDDDTRAPTKARRRDQLDSFDQWKLRAGRRRSPT